jgi:acyl-CoA thioester hydrolase
MCETQRVPGFSRQVIGSALGNHLNLLFTIGGGPGGAQIKMAEKSSRDQSGQEPGGVIVDSDVPANGAASRPPSLDGYPVLSEIAILWGDEDAFGHVNNVSYLRWAESARVDYLRKIDFFPPLPPEGIGPILASITCHYRRQLTYPDTVVVGTRVTAIGNSSFRMEHRIVSRASGEVVADVDSTIVAVDYTMGKGVRVSEKVRRAIADLEGRDCED